MKRLTLVALTCVGLIALAACSAIPVSRLSAGTSMITSGGSGGKWQEIPTATILLKDPVYMITYVHWEPVDDSAGIHNVVWLWYHDGKVVNRCDANPLEMKKTPYRLWCRTQAAGLGVGHYRVELTIDGVAFSQKEFDIIEAIVDEDDTKARYETAGNVAGPLQTHCPNALQATRDVGFPSSAAAAGLSDGSVTLAVVLSPAGSLKSIRVIKSSETSFDQAAIDAAAKLICSGAGLTHDTEIRWEIAYRVR